MSTAAKEKKETKHKQLVDEMIAKEVAAFDRYLMEQAKEMSRPKKAKTTNELKTA